MASHPRRHEPSGSVSLKLCSLNQNQTVENFVYIYIYIYIYIYSVQKVFNLTKPHIKVLFMILSWKNKTEWTFTSLVLYWSSVTVFIAYCAVTVFIMKCKIKEGMFSQTLNF
jgi:hypothetical protein